MDFDWAKVDLKGDLFNQVSLNMFNALITCLVLACRIANHMHFAEALESLLLIIIFGNSVKEVI